MKNTSILEFITVKNKELFWEKLKDVQYGFCVKDLYDLLRKEMQGIFESKDVKEEQKKKYMRSKYEITQNLIDDKKINMPGLT